MDQAYLNFKACPFVNVGDTKVKLSDLTVTGYEDELENGNVSIRMLSRSGARPKVGKLYKEYFWVDDGAKKGWQDGDEEWMEDDNSTLGNADEIEFNSGDGIVMYVKSAYSDCQLLCNGQVVMTQTKKEMAQAYLNFFGNPLARAVKLSEMFVEGYEDEIENGNFSIRMLSRSGARDKVGKLYKEYFWVDDGLKSGWQDGDEEWMEDDNSSLGNADAIEFAAGDGVTVYVKSAYTDCLLSFPSLEGAK